MTKKCLVHRMLRTCLSNAKLQTDYPSSFLESLLKSLGIIKVKRCSNCNAAVFVVLGFFTTSRKKFKAVRERTLGFAFVFLLLVVGYVIFEAIVS